MVNLDSISVIGAYQLLVANLKLVAISFSCFKCIFPFVESHYCFQFLQFHALERFLTLA